MLMAYRADILEAVTHAASVVPPKPTKEALAFLRLWTDGNGLCFVHGTDLELHVLAQFKGASEGDKPFQTCLPAAQLLGALKNLPDGEVVISLDKSTATISSGRNQYTLPTTDPDQLPDMPQEDADYVDLAADDLRNLLRRVSFAASKDSARFSMNGVRLEVNSRRIRAVATDGRRLALAELDVAGKTHLSGGKAKELTIPNRAVSVLERAHGELARASFAPRKFTVSFMDEANPNVEKLRISTLLVEGRFPDYEAVLPKSPPETRFEVDGHALAEAVRRAAVTADQETRRLDLNCVGGQLILEARTTAGSSSHVEMDIESTGKPASMFMNPSYLLDGLKAASMRVGVEMRGSNHPLLLVDDASKCLLMPLT